MALWRSEQVSPGESLVKLEPREMESLRRSKSSPIENNVQSHEYGGSTNAVENYERDSKMQTSIEMSSCIAAPQRASLKRPLILGIDVTDRSAASAVGRKKWRAVLRQQTHLILYRCSDNE